MSHKTIWSFQDPLYAAFWEKKKIAKQKESSDSDCDFVTEKKKRKRCGECVGCQKKDNCGECAPCRNDKSHQICKLRRCDKLTEKKPRKPNVSKIVGLGKIEK